MYANGPIMTGLAWHMSSNIAAHIVRCDGSTIRAAFIELLELRAEVERLTKERAKAEADMIEWRKAIQRLTPGGSEFTSPKDVVAWVERTRASDIEAIKRAVLRQRETEARAVAAETREKALREALGPFGRLFELILTDQTEFPDDTAVFGSKAGRSITYGDFRRAQAALGEKP